MFNPRSWHLFGQLIIFDNRYWSKVRARVVGRISVFNFELPIDAHKVFPQTSSLRLGTRSPPELFEPLNLDEHL